MSLWLRLRVPLGTSSGRRSGLGGRCRFHMVEGADHVFSTLPYKAEAIEVSRDFLVSAFTPGG